MFLCPCQHQDSSVTTALPTAAFNFAHGEQGVVAVQEQVLIMGLQTLFIRLIEEQLKTSWYGVCKWINSLDTLIA